MGRGVVIKWKVWVQTFYKFSIHFTNAEFNLFGGEIVPNAVPHHREKTLDIIGGRGSRMFLFSVPIHHFPSVPFPAFNVCG